MKGARCKGLLRTWERLQHDKSQAHNCNVIRDECLRREKDGTWNLKEICTPSLHLPRK